MRASTESATPLGARGSGSGSDQGNLEGSWLRGGKDGIHNLERQETIWLVAKRTAE